jgi:hypothetical protein
VPGHLGVRSRGTRRDIGRYRTGQVGDGNVGVTGTTAG